MNGIEKITARIEADAQGEAAAILKEANQQAAAMRAEFDKEAQDTHQKLIRDGMKDTEQRVQRLIRGAEMDSKKNVLSVKQEMVSAAFLKALKMMAELSEDKYVKFFGELAGNASRNGMEEVVFNKTDSLGRGKKVVKSANGHLNAKGIQGRLTVSADTRNIVGGFILIDGDIQVNCAAETLAESVRNKLATQVAEVMFGA